MIVTLFVGLIMALVNFFFTVDTEVIVVFPISKMMKKIRDLADDPLTFKNEKENKDQNLEQNIHKIR